MLAMRAPGIAALLGSALLAGCWHYESKVPAIVEADRPAFAPIAAGTYCPLEEDQGLFVLDRDECGIIAWDAVSRRILSVEARDDDPKVEWYETAPLGDKFVLLQGAEGEVGDDPPRQYIIAALISRAEGFAMLDLPDRTELASDAASRHGVQLEVLEDSSAKDVSIEAGEPAAIRAFVLEAVQTGLANASAAGLLGPEDEKIVYMLRLEGLDPALPDAQAEEKSLLALQAAVAEAAGAK